MQVQKIHVVIPYYQRNPGILRRAVSSVYAQDYEGEINVIVVDDESPITAVDEISKLNISASNINVQTIRQSNVGPGGARNTGLNEIKNTDYVAFLDSDDYWEPNHLTNASIALKKGCHIYSCNWLPNDSDKDAHTLREFGYKDNTEIASWLKGGMLKNDILFQQITKPILKLSTLVFNYNLLRHIRFSEDLHYASEDILFTCQLSSFAPSVFISYQVEVYSGKGINIHESIRYGTNEYLYLIANQIQGRKRIKKLIPSGNADLNKILEDKIKRYKKLLFKNFLTCLRRGQIKSIFIYFCVYVKILIYE